MDVHSHVFPDRFLKALAREGEAYGVRVEAAGRERLIWNSPRQSARIGPVFYDDMASRLEALERWGIAQQALSLSPPMLYWAPPPVGRELARTFNEEVEAICRTYPGRFISLATLPLQDVEASLLETDRAARAGARGVNHQRLAALKTKYDPGNFFRLNQNIRPTEAIPGSEA